MTALDDLYDFIDDMLLKDEFERVDAILEAMWRDWANAAYSAMTGCGVLTMSRYKREHLPHWERLMQSMPATFQR